MRVALIASPFISVPPRRYGGTELFLAQLAEGLKKLGIEVIVYGNGESTVNCEVRWLYEHSEWPIGSEIYSNVKDLNHSSWAVHDCWHEADIIHLNNTPGLGFARFGGPRFAYTIHHAHDPGLSQFYSYFPQVHFVAISRFQRERESIPRIRTIRHGIDMRTYKLATRKQPYFSFLGRIAPPKGVHSAIELAKRTGIPLKIAGEVQPLFQDYFNTQVKPNLDGKLVEYIGEADLATKNELLGNSMAMLFPIQWNEPFGLVMVEAMATGTPVLALAGGAVAEVVADGVSGYVCKTLDEMIAKARHIAGAFSPNEVRRYAEENFSVGRMAAQYAALYEDMLGKGGHKERAASTAKLTPVEAEAMEPLSAEPEEPRAIA